MIPAPPQPAPEGRAFGGLGLSELALGATTLALSVLGNSVLPAPRNVRLSLVTSAAICALTARTGVGLRAQGLHPRDVPAGVLYGGAAAIPVVAAVWGGALIPRTRRWYEQEPLPARLAAGEILLRIPYGTALTEELLFRGAFFGASERLHGPVVAAAVTSAFFGLWHIAPTLARTRKPPAEAGAGMSPMAEAAVSVVMTAAAGIALAWLRQKSGSVVAPWIAHSAANAAGLAAVWFTSRPRAATPRVA